MSPRRIAVAGELHVHDREVEIIVRPRWSDDDLAAAAAMESAIVSITIEPADAPEGPPAHGDALHYLAEAKRVLESYSFAAYVDGRGEEFQDSDGCKRLLSLLNSAHLAILAERRAAR